MTWISRSRGSSPRRARSCRQRDVDRTRHGLRGDFRRVADVEEELAVHGVPVAERHVAPKDIGWNHPRKVDGILRASERGRVAELGFFQVVDRRAHLDRHGQGIDPLLDAVLAQRLRPEETSVGFPENDFQHDRFGARVVPRVRVREQVDLLEVIVAQPGEKLLVGAGRGDRGPEDPEDRGALGAAETGICARRSHRPRSGPAGSPALRAGSETIRR